MLFIFNIPSAVKPTPKFVGIFNGPMLSFGVVKFYPSIGNGMVLFRQDVMVEDEAYS